MSCKHEKIKSVNCKIYCLYCGEELPIDYIIGKKRIEQQDTQENGENPPENAPEEQQTHGCPLSNLLPKSSGVPAAESADVSSENVVI